MRSLTVGSAGTRGAWVAVCAATPLLLVSGCSGQKDVPSATSEQGSALEVQVCGGTDAHDRHAAVGFACATCHPCGGGAPALASIVLPGGTTTAGDQILVGSPTVCSVGCHNPFGATPTTVAWNTVGPLACTACHAAVTTSSESSHPGEFVDASGSPTSCQTCHDTGAHLSGTARLVTPDGIVDAKCTECHDGTGYAIAGRTPPLLVGYSEMDGDWHGARTGTGWGGSLAPPYLRGQGPLRCTSCHDAHASANAFLLAERANGVPVATPIDRAGVGAEALCQACHVGERHAGCTSSCHRPNSVPTDPAPAGKPCFYCHGHEGIVSWNIDCHGCHNQLLPAPEYVPPAITYLPGAGGVAGDPEAPAWIKVKDVGVTGATIAWATDEVSTSYVEYGAAAAGNVSGGNALVVDHQVVLTGLSEHTTYLFRVRSSDRMRNVVQSPVLTFTTAWTNGPLAPILVPQSSLTGSAVTLRWNAVTDPDGDPVQYRIQVDDSPVFASPEVDSGWIESTSVAAGLALGVRHHWRVMARDATHDLWSPWSTTEWFWCWPEPDWD